MTGKDMFREVGNISEKYIAEAEETKRSIIQNVAFRRSIGTAACLLLCVGIFALNRTSDKSASGPQYDSVADSPAYVSDATNSVAMEMAGEEAADIGNNSAWKDVGNSVEEESDLSGREVMVYDEELTIERLQAYSNDYEELLQTDAFVVVHGTVKSDMAQWEAFLDCVEEGEPAYVDVIQFTEEGDAIITAIQFVGKYFYVLVDHTRDAWGNPNCSWEEYGYPYLYLDIQDGRTRVVLSELKLEEQEIGEALVKNPEEFDELFQYTNN